MLIKVLKSKLHRAAVTDVDLDYIGSITIDVALGEAADLAPGECVLVADLDNGERFETYVMAGDRGSGTVCLNGAAARRVAVGHRIIVMSWAYVTRDEAREHTPVTVVLDAENTIRQRV